jgi:hypothetical protein
MSSIVPDLELPILTVDEAHWQKLKAESEPLEYSIDCRDGFRISTKGFDFPVPEGVDFEEPNIIQLVMGNEQLYAAAYERNCTFYTLDKNNLVAMYGSKPFTGFYKGQKVILAIGHLSPPRADLPRPKFTVMWAGVVNVL